MMQITKITRYYIIIFSVRRACVVYVRPAPFMSPPVHTRHFVRHVKLSNHTDLSIKDVGGWRLLLGPEGKRYVTSMEVIGKRAWQIKDFPDGNAFHMISLFPQ